MNTTDNKEDLKKYIEDLNSHKNINIISDLDYWADKGVKTPCHLDRYMLISNIQEKQKQIYGFCKSRILLEDITTAKLNDLLDYLKSKRKT